ncbi:MAG TPA: metalloregulator ArsR/SmtB family transcription factor [Acidobacteriota bacterium]|nr:metalloregulator ArsR/SmtB family transcription factor [Acidobacteriota bacterium]
MAMNDEKAARLQKCDLEEPRLGRLAVQLKALAHPARLAILRTLAARSSCICGEIVEVMPLAQSTVSQHLRELRRAGLIRGEVDGPRCCYCLDAEELKCLRTLLGEFFEALQDEGRGEAPDCCP